MRSSRSAVVKSDGEPLGALGRRKTLAQHVEMDARREREFFRLAIGSVLCRSPPLQPFE